MFHALGRLLLRTWPLVLAVWVAAFAVVFYFAPAWGKVVRGGQFVFLPDNFPSRQAEALFDRAFPGRLQTSNVAIIVFRDGTGTGAELGDQDRAFISDVLKPRLEKLLTNGSEASAASETLERPSTVTEIRTFQDRGIGPLLISADRQASLVVVELSSDFMESRNHPIVERIENIVRQIEQDGLAPAGLNLALSGSATLGRDIMQAETSSAHDAQTWTIVLVVLMLLAIYRAPLLALVPLLTLTVSVQLSLRLLALLAQAGYVTLFEGLEVYATVMTYGPGVDYCLFLVARYRENLDLGADPRTGLRDAMVQVGPAVTASAGTVICGLAMLSFAQFGKFHEAGIGISFCLAVMLCALLTFTPALLLLGGRWAFWPLKESQGPGQPRSAVPVIANGSAGGWMPAVWRKLSQLVERRPGLVWSGTLAIMLPFAAIGVIFYNHASFGLVEELHAGAPSVAGMAVLKRHFPPGITGSSTVLIRNDGVDFASAEGEASLGRLVERIATDAEGLRISDIRSVHDPLGRTPAARAAFENLPAAQRLTANARVKSRARGFYVSHTGELSEHVARIDLILSLDPFSLQAAETLTGIERMIQSEAAVLIGPQTETLIRGSTASIRDLDRVSVSDRTRINSLVAACVFAILLILLRKPGLSLYLMASVLLSYLTALGAAYVVFRLLNGPDFPGLDWTVPIFLFVVLVAVGADYNIFLMTRIHEEQEHYGVVHGIAVALERTGGIITSCGIIMAGTFSSFMAGTIARMIQLGFALALGVLLDTFVVRPILVPAYLLLIHKIYPRAAEVPAPAGGSEELEPAPG